MADEQESAKNTKKWHQTWWGIIFLMACAAAFVYLSVLSYQIVYYVEARNNLKTNTIQSTSQINFRSFIEKDGTPFIGNKDAKIVIVEFGDFQCPICKAEAPIIRNLVRNNSSIKLIYRNFPNPVAHPDAITAALAAQCANEQGKFWEYYDLLFANQNDLSTTALNTMASTLGLNTTQFSQCLTNGKYFSVIQSDMQDGLSLDISATPTFYINGTKVAGNIPYSTFNEIVQGIEKLDTDTNATSSN
ncbi:MAG: thioredoxin domain-containing protein [Patescibacteria group bacterium]|nr:thioredoxin domain-containing protein [Patescibacteria group bacterium]